MIKELREKIGERIRYEQEEGFHNSRMCECGRNHRRSARCWECWLDCLINGDVQDAISEVSAP